MKSKPSEYFLGAILRGYDKEAASGKPVTCSSIWDRIAMECLRTTGGFETMFQWDTRRSGEKRNRIGTIMECIEAGLVPGLCVERNDKGHSFVVRAPLPPIERHKLIIEKAIADYRPVPPEVLADYPDLAAPRIADTQPALAGLL